MRKAKTVCLADLAKVGPGTPAGQWFRRYWMVAGTTRDLFREIILNGIRAVQDGRVPKGVINGESADEMVKIDSFTGLRAKGIV